MSYIGQTRYSLEFRWRQHQHKKDNTYFHNAIRKYGAENFECEILEECDAELLDSKEIFYIAKYNTFEKGYNLTIGGDGKRKIVSDDQYEEIKELYLSGFSAYKIGTLFGVDKATITKILRIQGVKIRSNAININRQEMNEVIEQYHTGCSIAELAKRYGCSKSGMKGLLLKNGVDLREKYSILKDEETQVRLVEDYVNNKLTIQELSIKYHTSQSTVLKIFSLHGVKTTRHKYLLDEKQSLEAISDFNKGMKVKDIADKFGVAKITIYKMLQRYHVNYLTV